MRRKNQKHLEHADAKKIKLINFISFLFGFSEALLIYVLSDYFRQALGIDNVSVFYFVAYSLALIGLLNLPKAINRFGKSPIFFLLFFLQICLVTILIFVNPSILGAVALMVYLAVNYLTLVMMDIILEAYSEDKKSGRIRGTYLTVLNLGFILGPFLSTRILSSFGFSGLFLIALVGYAVLFVTGLLGLRNIKHKFQPTLTVRDVAKKILVNKDLMRIYIISFALEFFYALMVVYTPIYLLNLGFSWQQIGIIFTIMLFPFVIFEYPLGFLADKKFGEKEMLIIGLIVIAISTGSIYFFASKSVFVWASVLLATRCGAVMIDILRDSYFYKKIDGRDADIISFYRTACSFAYIVSTGITALILIFFPVKSVFLLVAAVALIAVVPAFGLVDNKSEAELEFEYQPLEF